MTNAYICDYVRTPIGRFGGALSGVRADDLAAVPISHLMEKYPSVDWDAVEEVVLGCANQAGEDNRNVARMAALLAGLPVSTPGTTINRLCGSGLDAVSYAARALRLGEAQLVIAGGVESMSRAPFVVPKAQHAFSRSATIEDTTIGWRFVNPRMHEKHGTASMPETAENVAERFGISREAQDAFAARSQERAARAVEAGYFAGEITQVEVPSRRGLPLVVTEDEHPRPTTGVEQLAKLPTPFRDPGTVTAGNSSGVNDGASALILANETTIAGGWFEPRARIVAAAAAGVEPDIMGIGPVPATRKVLRLSGLSLSDIDLIELNEAFASQAVAALRELGLPEDAEHVNPNGGAIALGHPLGMSGARLVGTAMRGLEEIGGRYALCTMCVGVGQGISMIIERV